MSSIQINFRKVQLKRLIDTMQSVKAHMARWLFMYLSVYEW